MTDQRIICETCGIVSIETFPGVDAGLVALELHKSLGGDIHIASIVDAISSEATLSDEQLKLVLSQVWGEIDSSHYRLGNIQLTNR